MIMAVALIVVGPEKLPELARGLAKQLVELKKAANVLKESLHEDESEQDELDRDLPIGFSRPEELAAAGRKAAAIEHGKDLSEDGSDTEEEISEPPDAEYDLTEKDSDRESEEPMGGEESTENGSVGEEK